MLLALASFQEHLILPCSSQKKIAYLSFFFPRRCRHSDNLRHTGIPVRAPALWHPPRRISLRADHPRLAALHEHDRPVQHHPLEPPGLHGTQSLLHDQIPQEDQEVWLDVSGRNSAVHDR
jgi:hypothetical protein